MRLFLKHQKPAGVFLCLIICFWFIYSVFNYTGGQPSQPLDDSFIYFQFAKNLVSGKPMQWSAGDGFCSGATSPIYPLILAPAYLFGTGEENIIWWSWIIGLICMILSFFIIQKSLTLLLGETCSNVSGTLAGWFLILSGAQWWGYLNGMETPLFSTGVLAVIYFSIKYLQTPTPNWKTSSALFTVCFFMSLLRPEGLVLSILLTGTIIINRARREGIKKAFRKIYFLLSITGMVVWLIIVKIKTGHILPSTVYQKSFLYDPTMNFYLCIASTLKNAKTTIEAVYLSGHSPPLMFLFFAGAILLEIKKEIADKKPSIYTICLTWLISGLILTSANISATTQHFRYQIPFFNIYILVSSVAIAKTINSKERKLKISATAVVFFFITHMLINLGWWVDTFGMNSKNIFDQQIRVGNYIRKKIPPDKIVGVNDAGAILYYGGTRGYDIMGLTTEGQSLWFRHGEGTIFEKFEHTHRKKLPSYFAIYPRWWFNPQILKKKLFDVMLKDNTICGDNYKAVYKADWGCLHSGDRPEMKKPEVNLKLIDRVDIADLISEKNHNYKYKSRLKTVFHSGETQQGKLVCDGGRVIQCNGISEKMVFRLTEKGKHIFIARMKYEGSEKNLKFEVFINKTTAGSFKLKTAGNFTEKRILINPHVLHPGQNEVQLKCSSGIGQQKYTSFHYWIYYLATF